MNNKEEILWNFYHENMNHAFHHEEQRANVTNYILVIGGAMIGLITFDNKFSCSDLVLSLSLILLGIYGALIISKHHERFLLHYNRAEKYKFMLSEMFTELNIIENEKISDRMTKSKNQKLNKLRLSKLWLFLHISISIIGLIISCIILYSQT